MGIAALLAAYIYVALPHEREVTSLGLFVLKLTPFFLASIGIAVFPRRAPAWLTLILIFLTFLPFLGFLVPRQLYFIRTGMATGLGMAPGSDTAPLDAIFAQFYTITAILVPFVFLMTEFAYRVGGGTVGNALKVGWSGILLMLSGFEDIMFFAVNGYWPMPDVINWASHMTVRLGRPATREEFFVICALHLAAILLLWLLPLDRWIARLTAWRLSAPPTSATPMREPK